MPRRPARCADWTPGLPRLLCRDAPGRGCRSGPIMPRRPPRRLALDARLFCRPPRGRPATRLARIVAVTAPVRTTLHLVRHCDVDNPEGVLYGHLPGFRLSEKGVRQAHALGEHFAGRPVRQIDASPLERAQQTAHIIASYLDNVPVVTTPELVEARFCLYLQGIKPKDVPLERPLWFVHMLWPG